MELQILVSKKGTKVVTATNLHLALELPKLQYATNAKKWLNDVYEFRDGIRKPQGMKDFAKKVMKGESVIENYYISIELAKMITLNSKSKKKQKYAKWLLSLEDKVENAELLTKDQVVAVMELAKVMGMVSVQTAAEQKHLEMYESRNAGQSNNWWPFRASITGYNAKSLRERLKKVGKNAKGKTQRQMLMHVDKYEMIRTSVIDLFMSMGKSERYARNLGDLAKIFAGELNVEIFDDRKAASCFLPNVNLELANEVKDMQMGGTLQIWES
ncbi:MAG: phage anti-repressor protein [Paraglaciecola sp.]|jgi:phage anti-repressor protein